MLVEKVYNIIDSFHANRLYQFYNSQNIDAVIDVGSHKGEFITKVIRNKDLPIYSFEPQQSVRNALLFNTESFNVIEYFNFAASDRSGEMKFFVNKLTSTSSLILPNHNGIWTRFKKMILGGKLVVGIEKTKVFTLDEILGSGTLNGYKNILLKIDTEGFENRVLQGAKKIIQGTQIHLIQVESMNHMLFSKNPLNSSNKILESMGFKLKKKFLFPALNFFDVVYERK